MNLNNIPYGYHEVTDDDVLSVLKTLKDAPLSQGLEVPKFEEEVNKRVNANYSVAVNSATSALHLGCLALGLKKGDYVWTSPITFVSSANCALFCGASVDFIDIELNTGLISIDLLKKKLIDAEKNNKLPKIIIPVHLAGTSCDMKEIHKLSLKYNFHIIEDASHAIGGSYHLNKVGSCKYSDITVFSFHPVKIITTGEGGLLTTNNSNIFNLVKLLRSHGVVKDESKFLFDSLNPWHYEQQVLGFNFRMSELNAALGNSQIKRLDLIVKKRNQLLLRYKESLKDLPIRFLDIPPNIVSSVHLAIISLVNKSADFHREVFLKLHKKNIFVQLHYQPVHLNPYYQNLGFSSGDFPNSENYSKSSFSIPLYPNLDDAQFDYVVNSLKSIINEEY